jgi:glutamate/tyrosine decarboxylase-like PLP-dependent enzyme
MHVEESDVRGTESTLDPENWDKLRILGHRMLDDMLRYQQTIRTRPFNVPPKEAINAICVPLTVDGEGEEPIYDVFVNHILPYAFGNQSPLFWGLVVGTGSPYGMLTEMLRGGVNSPTETFTAEGYVHRQVIEWIKELLGFPTNASGVIVSGGSEANFTCLAVARNAQAEVDLKTQGLHGLRRRMTLYCSDETHHCLERSVELLGLGNEALRWIPTDEDCKIRLDALQTAITEDRKQNHHPFCVIGCAGTVTSGAFDDLPALANLCAKENLWFHIDGAFGAWVKLSDTHGHLANGLERADSVAVDLHKWMSMPYGIGCALVRDPRAHYSTFVYGHEAQYLKSPFADIQDKFVDTHNLALPLSRNFNSLKAYMLLRAYGKRKYSQLIQQNINHIHYLAELIKKHDQMEITAPVTSNIVCFRYKPHGLNEEAVDQLNKLIYEALCQINFMIISDTTIKGTYMLRACNVNHRSQKQDFEFLVNEIERTGRKLASQVTSRTPVNNPGSSEDH